MELKEKTFYVVKYEGGQGLIGYDEEGNPVDKNEPIEIIFFNAEKRETNRELREATELEKEYWYDAMEVSDELFEEDYGAVSLCEFENWKKEKGYK